MSNHTTQTHSGSGDNVKGDKFVIEEISPSSIQEQLVYILDLIRERQATKAKQQLANLRITSRLNTEAKGIIDILEIVINLADGNIPERTYKTLNFYHLNTENHLCIDITESALIRFFIVNKQPEDAKQLYRSKETHEVYTNEIFYELLANEDEIEKNYKDNKPSLSVAELNGLIRGSLRLEKPRLALTIAEYLNNLESTYNSKILLLTSKIQIFNLAIDGKQYWSITATLQKEVIGLCDEASTLLEKNKGEDIRIIQMSVGLLQFLFFDYRPLSDVCWDYITVIDPLFPDVAVQLRNMYKHNPKKIEHSNGVARKAFKMQENSVYRKEFPAKILLESSISVDDASLLNIAANKEDLQKWFNQGGIIVDDNKFDQDFFTLDLRVLACDKNPKDIDSIRLLVTIFTEKYHERIKSLSQPRLLFLAERLLQLELSSSAYELLNPLIEKNDLWVSPLVFCYLNSLLKSRQFKTLNSVLNVIDKKNWNYNTWQIKANLFSVQHKYNEAINCIEEAITLEPKILHGWYLLVDFHQRAGSNKDNIFSLFSRIPLELFANPSELGFLILRKMLRVGYFKIAEEYLINWFIQDPEGCAIPFLNISFDPIINGVEDRLEPLKETKKCFGGVEYLSDGDRYLKLLVSDNIENHQYLLSINSPLGQILSNMSVGGTEQYSMADIKLLRNIPPYSAIFSIAISLRQAMNDGTDCFYSLNIPKDPKELPVYLERKLSMLKKGDRSDKINADPKIPLFMKGYYEHNQSPVQAALIQLNNKKSFKHPLPDFGEHNPNIMILDIYSIIYLAMTGLVNGLDNLATQTIITIETKKFLEDWCDSINNKDYLTVDVHPDGGLVRTTSVEIQERTADIQEGIKHIITNSEVVDPQIVDYPIELLILENILDLSVLSSIKLMIANETPWLCIDPIFAQLLSTNNYKLVNSSLFISQLSHGLQLEQKQGGLYSHVTVGLPFPITYSDMFLLSQSKSDHAHYFLSELLKMYPDTFSDTHVAVSFTSQVLGSVLITAFIDREILRGFREDNPRNNGYAERIFNACFTMAMRCRSKHEMGYKLALLFIKLQEIFQGMPTMRKLINLLAIRFCQGHFINIDEVNKHIKEVIDNEDYLSHG